MNTSDSLEMIGLDSLKRAQLYSILEEYYGASLTPEFIFDVNTTFDQLVEKINVLLLEIINDRNKRIESQSSDRLTWKEWREIRKLKLKLKLLCTLLQREHSAKSSVVKFDILFVLSKCNILFKMDASEFTKEFVLFINRISYIRIFKKLADSGFFVNAALYVDSVIVKVKIGSLI